MKPGDLVVCRMKGSTHDDLGVFLEHGEKMPEENDHRKKGVIMIPGKGVIETVCFIKAPDESCKEFWSNFERRKAETR
jgi:hypothetical protein